MGADSYASQLTNEAKKSKKTHLPGMMRSLNRLLIAIGILIVPIGGMLFYRQTSLLGLSLKEGVETTAAAVIGMIPEGLYLMVSLALAASVLRLAAQNTLVQDLKCTETLARVDVLCVDKTGTITQPEMAYCGMLPLATQVTEAQLEKLLSDFVSNMEPDNETMQALQKSLRSDTARKALQVLGFSSETKYSAVSYGGQESYVLGAPELFWVLRATLPTAPWLRKPWPTAAGYCSLPPASLAPTDGVSPLLCLWLSFCCATQCGNAKETLPTSTRRRHR